MIEDQPDGTGRSLRKLLRKNEEEESHMTSDFNTTAGDVDWVTMDERSH